MPFHRLSDGACSNSVFLLFEKSRADLSYTSPLELGTSPLHTACFCYWLQLSQAGREHCRPGSSMTFLSAYA